MIAPSAAADSDSGSSGLEGVPAGPAPFGPSIFAFLALAVMIGAAFLGFLGGGAYAPRVAESGAARLSVSTAPVLRTGEYFEMEIEIAAKDAIGEAVLGVTPAMWRYVTINSFYPAAAEEEFSDGAMRFKYGPMASGDRLYIKIDGQLNMNRIRDLSGEFSLEDGEERLVTLPVTIKVWP